MNLDDLAAFAAVAEARSFRGAAYARGVAASSLSDAVRRLERELDVRLLHRTTRSVTPTDAGQRLLERLTPALREVQGALDAINAEGESPVGNLRLNVPTIVARVLLPPLIGPFLARHPGIRLEVVADDRLIDVLAAGFDAGVRYDEHLEGDMVSVLLGPATQRFAVAATPDYLARHGVPTHPGDLVRHSCIGHRFASGLVAQWSFERGSEVINIHPGGRLLASALDLELQAALEGVGLICSFADYLREPLADGRLVEVLAEWSTPFPGPRLYYADRRQPPAPLRAFVAFLRERNG
ncbi:LysR substrate-binding domain-containing protein [Pseudomonas oryzihabitans]|uniref:LysR family transcriptional regulator n=1 Tax=Pseudomonas oryzihabitans TaxID=47885 RepID=UPI0028949F79|nr:LysR substrate-binding domain-containing protein [Pseudomonas oryzihabitans]MDT3718600.1 LysR substrate-binding domain-containing protein [Pseudomonas oryzihabitans]